jgi:hypothetical protein
MKLAEDKVILTEEELSAVKRASANTNIAIASAFLRNALKETLTEDVSSGSLDYAKVIQLYRTGKYEVE